MSVVFGLLSVEFSVIRSGPFIGHSRMLAETVATYTQRLDVNHLPHHLGRHQLPTIHSCPRW